MGGTQSKATVTSLQQTITNISSSVIQSCAVNSTQDQNVESTQWAWFGSNSATVKQSTDIDFKCATNSSKQTDLQNQVTSAIVNGSSSNGIALFSAFGNTKAQATTNVNNIVTTNLTMTNIQQTYISVKNEQKGMFSQVAIFGSNTVDVTQGSSIFARAVNEILENAGIYNTIANHVENTASATEENPLQFLADIFTGAASTAMYIVIAIVLIIIALGFGIVFMGKSATSGEYEGGIEATDVDPEDNLGELDPDLPYEDFADV
jgi:hypothetical protein